jgi:hypothetical protein
MAHVVRKEIAGVNLVTESEASITAGGSAVYDAFLVREGEEGFGDIDVRIHLELGRIPSVDGLQEVFRAGQAWSMYRDGGDYWLSLNPPAFEQPLWVARVDRTFTNVVVYCSEALVSHRGGEVLVKDPVRYPMDQILLMHVLAQRGGMLIHAAGIDSNGKGYIFPGRSGAGKTTLTQQFVGKEGFNLLTDDRIAIRKLDGSFQAFGTPWPGEAGIALNKSVPLSGMFSLCHGEGNSMRDMTPQEALGKILPVASIPWYDREAIPDMLSFCEDLVFHVSAYELRFKPGLEVVDLFQDFVSHY